MSLRLRILAAFGVMSLITAALGLFAIQSVTRSGGIVVEIFGHALIATSYTRSAAANFVATDAALSRWRLAPPQARGAEAAQFEELAATTAADLDIAAQRSTSEVVTRSAGAARIAVAAWVAAARVAQAAERPDWASLAPLAEAANEALDVLVNLYAADAFRQRQQAQRQIAATEQRTAFGTLAALLAAGLVSLLLARRIIGPIAAASGAAVGIAAGQLETPIPSGGRDELGRLLAAMEQMRGAIRATIEGEQAERQNAEHRLADALEGSTEGIVLGDPAGLIVALNARAAELLPAAGLRLGAPWAAALRAGLGDAAAEALGTAPALAELRLAGGGWLRLSSSLTREGGSVAILSDVTALKVQEEALAEANRRISAALGNMSQGLCLVGADQCVLVCNQRFADLFGLAAPGALAGQRMPVVFQAMIAGGRYPANLLGSIAAEQQALAAGPAAQSFIRQGPSGETLEVSQVPMSDGGWLATYEDITARRRSEERIAFLAQHDAVTGLPNRLLLQDRAEQALAELGRGRGFAVLCLDLDRFRSVNDALGHVAGDAVLRGVAERLTACCRETDTVARLGADQFAIIQTACDTPETAALLGHRVLAAMGEPFEAAGQRVVVGLSLGVALAPQDGAQVERLLRAADTALHRAKGDGGGVLRFFKPEMDARLEARRVLEQDLRRAVANQEMELFYQPLVNLAAHRVSGFEALIRWRHPERGMVSPAEFIPLAEETGQIIPIGEWVVQRACRDAMTWPGDVRVAVNVSPVQFKSVRLVETVARALAESGLMAERLELEVTESVMLHDHAATMSTLHQLRNLGVRIAMDDFGTGYSSLSTLRSFPFDKIKIDQCFIRDLPKTPTAAVIVRAITGLGRSLGMRITAEGVETEQQLAQLQQEGCTEVQGYLFGRPGPAADVVAAIRRIDAQAPVLLAG